MSEHSNIEWCDATWNVLLGCSKAIMPLANGKKRLREGCRNCYAIRTARRQEHLGTKQYAGLTVLNHKQPEWSGKVTLVEHLLDWPLRKKKPLRIFVNAHSDLFHESVPDETIDRIFAVMALAQRHTFQLLTKRPERMLRYIKELSTLPWPIPNVWFGVSVEDQASADYAIPLLLRTPAAVRWISAEPLLAPITFRPRCNSLEDKLHAMEHGYASKPMELIGIDWVVVGGESGPNARPMHPDWARSLRDQCQTAGVPFFFKQWGEWAPPAQPGVLGGREGAMYPDGQWLCRVGKKAAGRFLDGREWNEYPSPSKSSRERV